MELEVGYGLVRMVDTGADTWRRIFDTNVIGASLATAAAIPHLTASAGKAVYLSSDAGGFGPPWPGLGAYGVSKAALERLVEAWRAEHPDVGFTSLIVGDSDLRLSAIGIGVVEAAVLRREEFLGRQKLLLGEQRSHQAG